MYNNHHVPLITLHNNVKHVYCLLSHHHIIKSILNIIKHTAIAELTIPFLLDEEMKINLFLRAKNLDEFTFLRENKDLWV